MNSSNLTAVVHGKGIRYIIFHVEIRINERRIFEVERTSKLCMLA